jgi:uncharacterized protein (DUF2147 family)
MRAGLGLRTLSIPEMVAADDAIQVRRQTNWRTVGRAYIVLEMSALLLPNNVRMPRLWLSRALVGFAVGLALTVGATARQLPMAASPLGLWQTKGGGVIEIGWWGAMLCGWIVGINRAPGEPMPKDYQGRSQCGLAIITDERPTGDASWLGQVTDPRDGSTYQAEIWVDDEGRLNLRGFVGIPLFGQTEIWHRFTGRLGAHCTVIPVTRS